MTGHGIYNDLGLHQGASISEIKAAYRSLAKKYHPDAEGSSPDDVEKFIKAQTAYQKLMKKAVAFNRARRAESAPRAGASVPTAGQLVDNWRFHSRLEVGLDVYLKIWVARPESGGLRMVLPWDSQEACPRCLGQGRTLAQVGSLYRPCACSKCEGRGIVSRQTSLMVEIKPELVGRDKIRLRQAGLYHPSSARRGDLILDITWVAARDLNSAH